MEWQKLKTTQNPLHNGTTCTTCSILPPPPHPHLKMPPLPFHAAPKTCQRAHLNSFSLCCPSLLFYARSSLQSLPLPPSRATAPSCTRLPLDPFHAGATRASSAAPVGGPVVADVKQIEFNSLSVGGLPWTSKLVSMHSYITNRYPHASDGPSPVQPQPSQALAEVAQALSMGVLSYCRTHSIDPSVACVLHIQGHPKYAHNITDQEVRLGINGSFTYNYVFTIREQGVEVAAITGNRLNWVKKNVWRSRVREN